MILSKKLYCVFLKKNCANIQHPKSALTVFSGFSENKFQNRLYILENEQQKISKIFKYANYLDKSVVKLHFYLDKSVVKQHFYLDKSVIYIFTNRGYFYKYFTFGSRLIVPVFL